MDEMNNSFEYVYDTLVGDIDDIDGVYNYDSFEIESALLSEAAWILDQ